MHHKLEHIFLHILEYKKEIIVILDDFIQFNNVWMMQLFKNFNLIEVDAFLPCGVFMLYLLDGNDLLCIFVDCLDD